MERNTNMQYAFAAKKPAAGTVSRALPSSMGLDAVLPALEKSDGIS